MSNLATRVIKQISTAADNETYDVARVMAIFVVPLYMAMGWVEMMNTPVDRAFDFQAYGIGFGAIMTGLGAFLFLKKDTEPHGPAHTP